MSSSGERTEQPTAKRLRDARKRGQVSKSQDLTSALLLIAAVVVLWFAATFMGSRLSAAMRDGIMRAASFEGRIDQSFALSVITEAAWTMGLALLPLFAVLTVIALLVSYLQVGSIFAVDALKPSFGKINPAQNFQQKFLKSRPYIELAKTMVKLAVTVALAFTVLWGAREDIVELTNAPINLVASFTVQLIFDIGIRVGIAFLVIGAGDWFLQRFLHLKEMRMTKDEVRREYKESEGDPLIKYMRKRLHREILAQSMMAAVQRADVVVVNPTHVAVALAYDRANNSAPLVVAKGADLMARQIREIAQSAQVPLMRDVPLARALYELEVDEEVPEELYEAVATVLRWVYELAEERGEVAASHG